MFEVAEFVGDVAPLFRKFEVFPGERFQFRTRLNDELLGLVDSLVGLIAPTFAEFRLQKIQFGDLDSEFS